ncbi:MAG: DNA-binding response regulator [Marinilabiliales bacterium]|nr:MAG: DNA-binding response regulator [Marinilabiliales bacterium]
MSSRINAIIVDDEPVAREVLETHLARIPSMNIVASCKNAMEAFQVLSNNSIDLIFLDINMPEISGLSLAKAIKNNTRIFFTTAYREYAVDGFDLQAVDYLLKPISFERLFQAITKFMGEQQHHAPEITTQKTENREDLSFFVRADRKMVRIDIPEIRYIESLSDYIRIHLDNRSVVTRETITNIEARLPKAEFLRVHRSFIVAISYIQSFTTETIEIGKEEIPISRSYKNEVLKKLE